MSELLESLPKETLCAVDLDETDVELVLKVIQSFEPFGVAARTLTESLLIQLKVFQRIPLESRSHRTPRAKFDLLAKKDRENSEEDDLSRAELGEAIALIQTLNPTPERVWEF